MTTVPVGAHSDTGRMTVEVEPGTGADRVRVRARIVYDNDLDPAPAAVVSADAVAPDGRVGVTAPLAYDADGVYAAELALPPGGSWTVRVTATNPAATGEAAYTPPPPTTTPATASATTGDVPADGTRLTGERAEDGAEGGADGDDTPIGVLLAVAVAFVVLSGVWFVPHRRRSGNTSPD